MLHLICALKHEAKPIIEYYDLVHDGSATLFNTYANIEKGITLTITGAGKIAAATGTKFAVNHHDAHKSDAWLNIGIAGHKNLEIGTAILVNKITDASSDNSWYPQITFETGLKSKGIRTLETPSSDYDDELYDMEAAGFYSSAIKISTSDLIHCLKIISDNNVSSSREISKKTVIELIENNVTKIENLITKLQVCSEKSATE